MVTVAVCAPGAVGAKLSVAEHFCFGATVPLQVVESEKAGEPEMLPPLKITDSPDFLLALLVRVTVFCFRLPTLVLPKLSEVRLIATLAELRASDCV